VNLRPVARNEPPVKDALYRETPQTAGRTTRILTVAGEFASMAASLARAASRCSTAVRTTARAGFNLAFLGMTESIGPMWSRPNQSNLRAGAAPRWSAPSLSIRTRREEQPRLCSSSAMSSDRLFLDRVGRHQSPSPLHRLSQTNTHSSHAQTKGDISTLLRRGHFYFALTSRDSNIDSIHPTRYDTATEVTDHAVFR
jgi:hypothetical protein